MDKTQVIIFEVIFST